MAEVLGRRSSRGLALCLGALFLLAACGGGSGGGGGGGASSTDVYVWTAWGSAELKAFKDVLAPFEATSGVKVHITTTRDSTNQIANGISAGTDLPDIARGPTDPVQVKDWISKGALKHIRSPQSHSLPVRREARRFVERHVLPVLPAHTPQSAQHLGHPFMSRQRLVFWRFWLRMFSVCVHRHCSFPPSPQLRHGQAVNSCSPRGVLLAHLRHRSGSLTLDRAHRLFISSAICR